MGFGGSNLGHSSTTLHTSPPFQSLYIEHFLNFWLLHAPRRVSGGGSEMLRGLCWRVQGSPGKGVQDKNPKQILMSLL